MVHTVDRSETSAAHGAVARAPREGYWRKRVLVCGGRYFDNAFALFAALNNLDEEQHIHTIINGGASGADDLARQWASIVGVRIETHPASWMQDGRSAGPKRNQRMIDRGHPDAVVAFPGGAGTADMIRRARKAGIPIYQPLADVRSEATITDAEGPTV